MSIETSFIAVLVFACFIESIIIWGLVRRVRGDSGYPPAQGLPQAGYRPTLIDPVDENYDWPDDLLVSDSLVVMVIQGCSACSSLLNDIDTMTTIEMPLYFVISHDDFVEPYQAKLLGIQHPNRIVVTRNHLFELAGWQEPTAFPAVIHLQDGRVVKSAYAIAAVV